jgi:tripartite motif-containing protein 71
MKITHALGGRRVYGALLALGAALALLLPPVGSIPAAQAATTLRAVRVIGGTGHAGLYGWGADTIPPGQPHAGNVLITDYWNFRIAEFEPDGDLVGYPVGDDGLHTAPYDVAVNPLNGNIAFGDVDTGGHVAIYSADGEFLRSCGNLQRWKYPSWLDYDEAGRLAVADSRGHKIVMMDDEDCAELFQFGSQGSGPAEFNTPRGIDFAADGTLWINDTNNRRVVQWEVDDDSATAVKSIPVRGGDLRGLLALDDELYVVNAAGAFVDVYDQDSGTRVRNWGGYGMADGRFVDGGRGLTADGDGDIWVGDMPGFRTQKFSPQGAFLMATPDPAVPPPVGGYAMPETVAAFSDGTVAGLDTFNWRINIHAPDGTPVRAFGTRNVFNYPRGLAADRREKTLVVGNTDGSRVDKYTLDGRRLWTVPGVKPWGVAVDQTDGTIYAAEFQTGRIRVLGSDGSLGPTITGGLVNPRGIAVDPVDRSVWVAQGGRNGRISHFSRDGEPLGSFESGAAQAADVEVSADTVFLADKDAHVIRMFSKAGAPTGTFGQRGIGVGRFRSPGGLELVGNRLYVMEMRGERIQELRVVVQ